MGARGPQCTLLVYIDDATSELMQIKMVVSESAFAYMDATREYIEVHGKPVAFYSDKHSVFRNNRASAKGDGMTHFGRAIWRATTSGSPRRRSMPAICTGPSPRTTISRPRWSGASNAR